MQYFGLDLSEHRLPEIDKYKKATNACDRAWAKYRVKDCEYDLAEYEKKIAANEAHLAELERSLLTSKFPDWQSSDRLTELHVSLQGLLFFWKQHKDLLDKAIVDWNFVQNR